MNYDWVKVLSYSKYSLLFLLVVGIEPATTRSFHSAAFSNQMPYTLHYGSCWTIQSEFFRLINLTSPSTYEILLTTIMYTFLPLQYRNFFFFLVELFWLVVAKSYSSLYLVYLTGHCSPTYTPLLQDFSLFPVNYFNLIPQRHIISLFFLYIVSHSKLFDLPKTYCFSMLL